MQLQLIYDEIAEKAQNCRVIKRELKDALLDANEYQETVEKIKELKSKKDQIEELIKNRLGKRWEEFEELQGDIKNEKVTLTDLAVNDLLSGKTVSVRDKFGNEYEPVWGVKFVKIK